MIVSRGGVLADATLAPAALADLVAALARKDSPALRELSAGLSPESRAALLALPGLYGGLEVLDQARRLLPARAPITAALNDLGWLAAHVARDHPEVKVGFDLADMGGYAYYSGPRFAVYATGAADALLRGGRYDEVGAVFGRNRAAVGFSTDLLVLVGNAAQAERRQAIRAPWRDDAALREAVRQLRSQGQTVVCILPGHGHEGEEFDCDRELVDAGGDWVVRAL